MKVLIHSFRSKLLTLCFLCTILLSTFSASAQEPLTYKIPSDLLENINVYSLAQDPKGRIWIASDLAVYMYNGYNVVTYKYAGKSVSSYFSLATNSKGDVFCCSLAGDIFRVGNTELELIYSLPDSCIANTIQIKIDREDNIVIQAKDVYILKGNKTIQTIKSPFYARKIFTFFEGDDILFKGGASNTKTHIYRYNENGVKKEANLSIDSLVRGRRYYYSSYYSQGNKNILYSWYDNDTTTDNSLASHPVSTGIATYSNGQITPIFLPNQKEIENTRVRFYGSESFHILAHPAGGAWLYDTNGKFAFAAYKMFPNLDISSVLEDQEGNLWLGTLSGGLYVIRDFNAMHYNNHPLLLNETVQSITTDRASSLFIGCKSGSIFHLKDDDLKLYYTHFRNIKKLHHFNTYPYLIIDCQILDQNKKLHSMSPSIGFSINGITEYKKNKYLIGAHGGIYHYNLGANGEIPPPFPLRSRNNSFKNHILTTSAIAFDSSTNLLWTSDLESKKIYDFTTDQEVKINHHTFQKMNSSCRNQYGHFTTDGSTIYWLDGYKLIDSVGPKNGILADHSLISILDSNIVIFKHPLVQLLNCKTKEVRTFSGLNDIKKFDQMRSLNGKFWMLSSTKSLVSFDPKKLSKNERKPQVYFHHVYAENLDITIEDNPVLDWQGHDLKFSFFTDLYKYQSSLVYYYKIDGLDDEWKTINQGENAISFPYLPSGDFTFMLKCVNENGIESDTLVYPFKISTPRYKSWWFFTLIALAVGVVIYGRVRLVNQRLKSERDKRIAEIRTINSQMNPHFVFNALNSVQDLIMQKDIRNSNIYLGKFADLMRQTLDYSQRDTITLKQEIETALLYLDLEKLRFGEDFIFEFNSSIHEEEMDEISIPSLLLQPYIENAIKHGLLHKKGIKTLNINLAKTNNGITIEIIDNGVGRKKSAEINARRLTGEHNSFALKANEQRLKLIRETLNLDITVNISDVQTGGTRVYLVIS